MDQALKAMQDEGPRLHKNLRGKALIFRDEIFHKKKRLTAKEWAKVLYGDASKYNSIYALAKRLTLHGWSVVPVPKDPSDPDAAGVFTPLTENRTIARMANRRQKARIDGTILTYGLYAAQELDFFPDMKPELVASLEDTVKTLAGQRKLALQHEKPLYIAKKGK